MKLLYVGQKTQLFLDSYVNTQPNSRSVMNERYKNLKTIVLRKLDLVDASSSLMRVLCDYVCERLVNIIDFSENDVRYKKREKVKYDDKN